MHASANIERTNRSHTKRKFCQFTRTSSTLDLRTNEHDRRMAERKRDAERYAARHGFTGKRAEFH
jgi:hypothetical protein